MAGFFGRRLNLPHHEFLSPIPPTPFPHGEGGDFWFISPGATAPGTPAPEPGRRGGGGAILRQAGGLPQRCRITLPSLSPMGHGGFCRRLNLPHHEFLSPIPPAPFPHGEGGDFWFSYARGFAPCIPGAEPGRRGDRGRNPAPSGGRGRSGGGLPWGRARTADYISNSFGKSSWGFGGFFQEAPERFPAMVPGGDGLSRGGRERRTASAIHSGKVLGGLGASFKKPPTFLRFFVSSFLRVFSVIPHLRSADSMT